jgi:hypothetical protein
MRPWAEMASAATATAVCNMTRPLAAGLSSTISTVRQHAYGWRRPALPAPVCEPAHRPAEHRQVISTATFQAGLPPRLMLLLLLPSRLFPLRKRHAPLAWLTNDDRVPHGRSRIRRRPIDPTPLASAVCTTTPGRLHVLPTVPSYRACNVTFFFSDHATSPFQASRPCTCT